MLDNEYLAKLPKNNLLAANRICVDYFEHKLEDSAQDILYTLQIILEEELKNMKGPIELDKLPTGIFASLFAIGVNVNSDRRIRQVYRHVKALMAKATIQNPSLINTFLVEFSEDEIKKIDDLLRNIRDIIRNSDVISEDHKRRILKVVNNLQAEIDKNYSDFRVFLDGMVEVSEAVGEAGENVKPVFDRLKELFGIANKVRKDKEAIESPAPREALPPQQKLLPAPESVESDDQQDLKLTC